MPRSRRWVSRSDEPWMKAELRVFGPRVELGPQRMALVVEVHAGVAAITPFRRQQPVVQHAPALARVVGRVLHPYHMTAELAYRGGEAVDGGDDRARGRNLALETGLHEVVLHVDHHEGGLRRYHHVERMRPAGASDDAFDHARRDRQFVHEALPRNTATGRIVAAGGAFVQGGRNP